ncbi:MAG: transglutaminase-like domain-containing protein [Spirochaetaceae bacterium]
MILLLYGFSLIFIITEFMGYDFSALQVGILSILCFVFNSLVLKSLKRFLLFLSVITISLASFASYLQYHNKLNILLLKISEFIKGYYLILTVETLGIDLRHQLVVILFIGISVMWLLKFLISNKKISNFYIIAISILLLIAGIVSESMGNNSDHKAFIVLICTIIIYYFYIFHQKSNYRNRTFNPYILICVGTIFIVFTLSNMFNLINPNPLSKVFSINVLGFNSNNSQVFKPDKLSYYNSDISSIDFQAEFLNIEVLKVKTNNTRYLKADVFEVYTDGNWMKILKLDTNEINNHYIQNVSSINNLEYNRYYTLEDTSIIYKNINTNIFFTNTYGIVQSTFKTDQTPLYDPNRGVYFSDNVILKGIEYQFTSILPNYGGVDFSNLTRELSKEDVFVVLELYTKIPENFDLIKDLAKNITEGIDNKYDQALAIERFLRANYTYNTKTEELKQGVDPILNFLFNNKEGFCQHFASAFILLTRSLDIPSRYVSGFYVNPFEPPVVDTSNYTYRSDGYASVYDSDAHTWPEVYFPEIGWIMFEPTPGRNYLALEQIELLENEYLSENSKNKVNSEKKIYIGKYLIYLPLLVLFYILYLFIRKRKYVLSLTETGKMLRVFDTIKYYYNYKDSKIRIGETYREYAKRIDSFKFNSSEIELLDLIPNLEKVLYFNKLIGDKELNSFILYLDQTRTIIKDRVSRFRYYKMLLVEYFLYIRILF